MLYTFFHSDCNRRHRLLTGSCAFCTRGLSLSGEVPPVGNWVDDPHPAPKAD